MSIVTENLTSQPRIPKVWLRAARVIWILLALIGLSILVTSLPGYIQMITDGVPGHGTVEEPGSRFILLGIVNAILSLASGILSLLLSLLLFRNKFDNPAIAAVSFYLLLYSIIMTGPLEAWGGYWLGNTEFAISMQALLMATPTVGLLALFPNGKLVPGWMRWVLIASIPWNILALLFPLTGENISGLIILGSLWVTILGLGFYAQVFRYRRVSTPDERQQTKWVIFGFALWMAYILISTYPYFYLTSMPPGTPRPWWASLSEIGWWLSLNFVPVAMAAAITRSRLWNIDIVINRTLVYGALTISTMTLYIFLVGTLGNILHLGDNTFIAFLTTGLVAVLFQPLRDRLQGWVNRFMYGERDDPVAVLAKLGLQLEKTGSPEAALGRIVETVARTLKLPYAAIELGDTGEIAASYGYLVHEPQRIPLIYQGEIVGQMLAAERAPRESFSSKDRQLLENIARQAGAAAHAARLTADLQRSRQRIVIAREEERRRLRRDLHDGLGPQLASQTLTIDAINKLVEPDPQAAKSLLADLKAQSQTAIKDIRQLIYDLRPPALDDLGLVAALKENSAKYQGTLQVTIDAQQKLPPLPAALEVAAYRIAQEAIVNIIRHARASLCRVHIDIVNADLFIEVVDDGRGLPNGLRAGVGLISMRERVGELSGRIEFDSSPGNGTSVRVWLPLPEEER